VTVRAFAAAAAAVAASAALPPATLPYLPLAVAVIFGAIAGARGPREAFVVGAAAALGLFALHILWLPLSFSALLGPAFWVLYPLLLAALAAIWGATAALARWTGGGGGGTLAVLAPLWVLVEWLRGVGFIGFPWGTLGYGWLDTPVAQAADLVGVHGLSLLTTVSAALLAAPFVRRPARDVRIARSAGRAGGPPWPAPLLGAALLVGAWLGGDLRGQRVATALPEPDRTAVLVQGDVDPFGRAASASQELDVHVRLSARAASELAAAPELVIWPEGAVLGYPMEGFRGEPARATIQAASPGSTFIVGGRARVGDDGANAVYAMADGELLSRYDKHVLVPFGERWPLLERAAPVYRAIFGLFGLPLLQNTVPGPGPAPLATPTGPVAAYVCYESVFPRIPRRMVAAGAEVLINVTNDAWFARGAGARQHFDMGRMRAIETRRWLLRAGNDGITAAVDPTGATRVELERRVRGTLVAPHARLEARTPFVRYGGWTPWALLGGTLLTLGAAAARRG
jgi:apolipoprotein N-acyltransferase